MSVLKGVSLNGYRTAYLLQQHIVNSGTFGPAYISSRPVYSGVRPTPDTVLIVDGFPRSANSYCYYGLKRAFGHLGEVRGHTHAGAVFDHASRRNIPSVALIRHPVDAVSSFLQYNTRLTPGIALKSYSLFYEATIRNSDSVLICSFSTITQDFSSLLLSIQNRFSIDRIQTTWSTDDDRATKGEVEASHLARNGGSLATARVPLPRSERDAARQVLAQKVVDSPMYSRAITCYRQLEKHLH